MSRLHPSDTIALHSSYIRIICPGDFKRRAFLLAEKRGLTLSSLIRGLLNEEIEKEGLSKKIAS
jgi:antitoxin component of RelBE/YafQ-DinJ toxin-antitoxin module